MSEKTYLKTDERTVTTWVRLPFSWDEKIREIAKDECRTIASVINQAVKEFLERRRTLEVMAERNKKEEK